MAEKEKGTLVKRLQSSNSEVKKGRASRLANGFATSFKSRLDRYATELDRITEEKEQLLDVNPTNLLNTKFDVNIDETTDTYIDLIVEEEEINKTYTILRKEYRILFGIDYEPTKIDLNE